MFEGHSLLLLFKDEEKKDKEMWGFLLSSVVACIGALATIITIVQFVFGVANIFALKSIIEQRLNLSEEVMQICLIIMCIILIGVIFVFKFVQYNKRSNNARAVGENMHRFHDDIRDEIFKLRLQNEKNQVTNHEDFYGSVRSVCSELCNKIHLFVKEKTNKEFAVCIKLLQTNPKSKDEGVYSYTLCRAGRDCDKRTDKGKELDVHEVNEHDILVPISENSAFDNILSNEYNIEKPTIFACSNLRMLKILNKILGRPPYKNPNKNFWKYYKSTIVVPIRINKLYLSNSLSADKRYLTMGFLCLDYKKPISKALKNELAEYSKSFADAFFSLFYEIKMRDIDIEMMESNMK